MRHHVSHDAAGIARSVRFGAGMGGRALIEGSRSRFARRRAPEKKTPSGDTVAAAEVTRMARARGWWSQRPRLGVPMLIAGTAVGALMMFAFDPQHGRRRRALVRDRLAHMKNVMTRDVPARAGKRGRFFRGVAKGIVHDTTEVLPFNGHRLVDNETLVARVRSEVLRDERIKAGEIHLDAYEGCVTLRGQLEHPESIRRLVHDTAHIDGVREVRNFLHLPGTPPPNKAAVYSRWELPAHMRR
jgi:hypothetical protein